MKQLNAVRRRMPVLYSITSAVGGIFLILLCGILVGQLVSTPHYYVGAFAQEAPAALLMAGLLVFSGCGYVLRRKGTGVLRGLVIGGYLVAMILFAAVATYAADPKDGTLLPLGTILAFFGTMLCIGLAEELLFRALIAETLLEHFGTTRAGVWKATLLSGVLFGCAHLSNLIGCAPLGVFVQVVDAAVLGMLLAAIYFRSGNIWVVVLLHAAMDTAALLPGGLYGTGGVADTVTSYTLINLIPCITYSIPTVFLLRKKKLGQIAEHFGGKE